MPRPSVPKSSAPPWKCAGPYQVRDLARVDLVWDGAQARVLEVDVSPSLANLAVLPRLRSLPVASRALNELLVSQYAR